MPAILALILPILAQLPGAIGDYFKKKQEIEQIKIQTEKEIEIAKQRYASELAQAEVERSKVVLSMTGRYFKYFTFFMWFGPFMIGVVSPSLSKEIFINLSGMPEWYVQSCMLIMFTIWGISVSAPVVSSIFTGLASFFAERREFKLEKESIKALSLNNKAFFDTIRDQFGPLSQKQVDAINKLLEKEK